MLWSKIRAVFGKFTFSAPKSGCRSTDVADYLIRIADGGFQTVNSFVFFPQTGIVFGGKFMFTVGKPSGKLLFFFGKL
ncbi:MAG: hypothetical protein NC299_14130 [Lachnospiraceae bacterium]|nr:hypothetical protein [Lachnospiraceae bacterium]